VELFSKSKDDKAVIFITGELDMVSINYLKTEIEKIGEKPAILYIDFKEIVYIDSIAIGFLINAHRRYYKYNKALVLANLNENIQKIFRVTNIDKFFNMKQDIDLETMFKD